MDFIYVEWLNDAVLCVLSPAHFYYKFVLLSFQFGLCESVCGIFMTDSGTRSALVIPLVDSREQARLHNQTSGLKKQKPTYVLLSSPFLLDAFTVVCCLSVAYRFIYNMMISVIAMVRQAESRTDSHWNETTPIDSTQSFQHLLFFAPLKQSIIALLTKMLCVSRVLDNWPHLDRANNEASLFTFQKPSTRFSPFSVRRDMACNNSTTLRRRYIQVCRNHVVTKCVFNLNSNG